VGHGVKVHIRGRAVGANNTSVIDDDINGLIDRRHCLLHLFGIADVKYDVAPLAQTCCTQYGMSAGDGLGGKCSTDAAIAACNQDAAHQSLRPISLPRSQPESQSMNMTIAMISTM